MSKLLSGEFLVVAVPTTILISAVAYPFYTLGVDWRELLATPLPSFCSAECRAANQAKFDAANAYRKAREAEEAARREAAIRSLEEAAEKEAPEIKARWKAATRAQKRQADSVRGEKW